MLEADQNPPTDAPQNGLVVKLAGDSQVGCNLVQVTPPVATNVLMRTLQSILGFSTYQVWVLVEDVYDTQ